MNTETLLRRLCRNKFSTYNLDQMAAARRASPELKASCPSVHLHHRDIITYVFLNKNMMKNIYYFSRFSLYLYLNGLHLANV